MEALEQVTAIEGVGLEGDRYALGTGAFSNASRETTRHVTLIENEAIGTANYMAGTDFSCSETRRNIITEGISLNGLVGVAFRVGEVGLRGVELCKPCARPTRLSGKPGFDNAFQNRGGLRAEVLTNGSICLRDIVAVTE